VAGWTALLLVAFLLERPLLSGIARLLDEGWLATVRPVLDCLTLAATGWLIGRSNRWRWNHPRSVFEILIFAVTLLFFDFGQLLALNGPWLFHVAIETVGDLRYLEGLAVSLTTHAVLLGSLIAGWMWSRPAALQPLSLGARKPER
jgi:hypothetical protein